jgi:hypothetical protein
MLRKLPFLLVLCLAVVLPTAGQRSEHYFSLSTDKTYLPGEKINLRVYSQGVSSLEFRIYRVNDPAKFFEHLRDMHTFNEVGVRPQEQVEAPTLLERFHDWKLNIWMEIRGFFRSQFSRPSRSRIRETVVKPQNAPTPSAAVFAQIAVLNESQLVARWQQSTETRYYRNYYYQSEAVPVSSLEKGAYLVEATDGNLRAYTILVVSDIAVITKTAPGQLVAYVANRHTGAPVSGAKVHVWVGKQESRSSDTNSSGLFESSPFTTATWPSRSHTLGASAQTRAKSGQATFTATAPCIAPVMSSTSGQSFEPGTASITPCLWGSKSKCRFKIPRTSRSSRPSCRFRPTGPSTETSHCPSMPHSAITA